MSPSTRLSAPGEQGSRLSHSLLNPHCLEQHLAQKILIKCTKETPLSLEGEGKVWTPDLQELLSLEPTSSLAKMSAEGIFLPSVL